MPPKLFSYVVDHDHGYAPNPEGGLCSLVHCKFGGIHRRRNIVELAEVGDWILGAGGAGRYTAGQGRIIYLMRVNEKISFQEYLAKYLGRHDCHDPGNGNRFALLSSQFYYFGRNAVDVARLPAGIDRGALLKRGMGHRRDMSVPQIQRLTDWFQRTYCPGIHGHPCAPDNPALVSEAAVRYLCRSARC